MNVPDDHIDQRATARAHDDDGQALTELPSTIARALAFAAVMIAGICGALIGYAVADLQCTGDCTVVTGSSAVIGAAFGAVGVGVVAVLVLRAMSEWRVGGR